MDVFSLEDDDYGDIFITQSLQSVENSDKMELFEGGESQDNNTVDVPLNNQGVYSDISDDDMSDFQCSQNIRNFHDNSEE